MTKRILDLFFSFFGLLLLSPLLLICMFLIWRQDGYSPFYIADRVGLNGRNFKMIKLRSMIKNADKSGVDSTSSADARITRIGHFVRRYKIDEISQMINVLLGDMSFVGPRPNIKRATDFYTKEELGLLRVKPGMTDISSVVFSDEGEILRDEEDPDLAYEQLIRPWKSKLGLFYISHQASLIDLNIIFVTIVSIFSRKHALKKVFSLLSKLNAPDDLKRISLRQAPLVPTPPPGSNTIVLSRDTLLKS